MIRWPGGCFADEYHWKNGIGTRARSGHSERELGRRDRAEHLRHRRIRISSDQVDTQAYVSINVGSGPFEEASEWLAYMTADQRSAAGKDRAANGPRRTLKVEILRPRNENWGCGGNMRPEHYVDLMKRYARFARNYNPAQQTGETMQRIAVGPTDDDTSYTEAVMKAWSERDWSWSIEGLSLHSYTVPKRPPSLPSTDFGEDDYALILSTTLKLEGRIAETFGDHGQVRSRRGSSARGRRVGRVAAETPARRRASCSNRTRCATRSLRRSTSTSSHATRTVRARTSPR